VPDARKQREFRVDPFGELYSHLFLDIEVFLAPDHLHGRFKPGQLRFEVILVPRKVRLIVGESVCRRHRAVAPSPRHVVPEFPRNIELGFLR
jgi:hypothetical protein